MPKILEIDGCSHCFHSKEEDSDGSWYCKKLNRKLTDQEKSSVSYFDVCPDWCPLKDSENHAGVVKLE